MEPAAALMFVGVFTLFALSPGPATVSVVSQVLLKGNRGVSSFIAGIIFGHIFWLSLTLAGLSVLAQSVWWLFSLIKYIGAAYLIYMAYRLWFAREVSLVTSGEVAMHAKDKGMIASLLGGLALTLGNPKTVVFYLALLPGFMNLDRLSWLGVAELIAMVSVILAVVLGGYAFLANRLRSLSGGRSFTRIVNRISSVLMVGAAGLVVSR